MLSPNAVRAQLDRILASERFVKSTTLSRLLRFVVERTLEGEGESLNESYIALEVFQREGSFDSRDDSIVRVQARNLRARLTEYYQGQGGHDFVIISIPKGGTHPF